MGWLHAVRGHSSRLFKIFKICPIFQDLLSELSDMGAFQRALRGGWSKDSNPRVYTSFRAGWASLSWVVLSIISIRILAVQVYDELQESNVWPISPSCSAQAASGRYYSALSPPLVNCGMQAGLKSEDFSPISAISMLLLRRSDNFRNGFSFYTLSVSVTRRNHPFGAKTSSTTHNSRRKTVEWRAFHPLPPTASCKRTVYTYVYIFIYMSYRSYIKLVFNFFWRTSM